MLRSFSACVVFLSCLLTSAQVSLAQDRDAILNRAKGVLANEIKRTLDDTGIPSISIALLKDDRVVWAEAFGYSNVKLQVPASAETVYCTASCFKPITAMAIMQLADQGRLKLDDPINPYLGDDAINDFSDDGEPITFRHLLSHYSGLPAGIELMPLWERTPPQSLRQLAAGLQPEKLPGKEYLYSNPGYALAGLLVEKVSGKSYERYLVENILKPVGVEAAGPVNLTPEMIELLALPYRDEDGTSVPERQLRIDVFPAGEIYLSVPDMGKVLLPFLNAGRHNGETILSEAAVEEMRTPQFGGNGGLDFGIRMFEDDTLIMHGGGVPGYSSKFILDVDSGVGVYVACNAGNARGTVQLLAQLSIDLLNGREIGSGLVRKIVGIGAGLATDEETGLLRVTNVIPQSPASSAKLANMLIHKIDGVSVEGKEMPECLTMLKGDVGAKLRLEIINPRNQESQIVELTRQSLLVPS